MSTHLPSPFSNSSPNSIPISPPNPSGTLELITQGAEALLYRTTWWDDRTPVALKIRPPKPWRHPALDRRLTRQRILAEARVLAKCRRDGVCVPSVYAVDWEAGWSVVEWIRGGTVKAAIRERKGIIDGERNGKDRDGSGVGDGDKDGDEDEGKAREIMESRDTRELRDLLQRIGVAVGKLHAAGVIHGDLTTSNMMLRPTGNDEGEGEGLRGEIVLIDFGLATQALQEEERAVDLYVLERAFGSTHPKEEQEFGEVLRAYESCYKGAKKTLRRLEDVRMRGRKKSMIG